MLLFSIKEQLDIGFVSEILYTKLNSASVSTELFDGEIGVTIGSIMSMVTVKLLEENALLPNVSLHFIFQI